MSIFKEVLFVSLAAATVSIANGEPHCPGNVVSLRPRLIANAQIVVPVTINHSGPYDFLLDTGAQITTVDPALAKGLNLKIEGTTGIIGVGSYARTPFTTLDSLQSGPESLQHVMAVIQDLGQIQLADARVRGVLAGNFLDHFGLLIDYRQRLICLDNGDALEPKMKGQHIGLVTRPDPGSNPPTPQTLRVAVQLSGMGKESLLFLLDSGINVPLLFSSGQTAHMVQTGTSLSGIRGTDGVSHAFAILAGQEVQVGPHALHAIPFVMPVGAHPNVPKPDVDGLLPTALFQRVYVNYVDHYVVLEPW